MTLIRESPLIYWAIFIYTGNNHKKGISRQLSFFSLFGSFHENVTLKNGQNEIVFDYGTPCLSYSINGFLKFLKKCFCAELSPFFYISLRFICKFEDQLRKNQRR